MNAISFPRIQLPAVSKCWIALLSVWVSGGFFAGAQETAEEPPLGVSTPSMQRQLEGLYQSWREAMEKQDFDAWKQVTSQARQGEIRNQIVSQRLNYPEAMFATPLRAPKLEGLIHIDTLLRGDTAASIYFGRADFGITEAAEVRENFIVLRYVKEFGVWKYDNLRVVKFGDDPGVLLKLRNGDHSFLETPEFQPAPSPAPIPGPVTVPDYIAELWVTSVGFETIVTINAQHHSAIANDSGRELINGGLRKGANRISVEVKPIPVDSSTPRHLEIGIYGAKSVQDKAERFYHFRTEPGQDAQNFQTTFPVP
ncbi:MAG: hypothetical protein KDN19_06830 [Verrucomicrobiae bacterium]|nr:hypothetical protein [Verrucomicrobiae bacterium]